MVEWIEDRKFLLLKIEEVHMKKVNVTYAILYNKTNEKILMVKKQRGKWFLLYITRWRS